MLTGADKFKTLFEKYIKEGRPVLLYGDPDVDGLYSLFLMAKFVEMMGVKDYTHFVNEKRKHDWEIPAERLNGYLVISADFTVPKDVLRELTDNNVVVLASDHHEINDADEFIGITSEKTGAEAIFITNQYSFEPDDKRFLSGAGVFYELVCAVYPQFECHLYKALVGITLLSDIRDTNNDYAKDYLKATYTLSTTEPYAKYLLNTLKNSSYNTFGRPTITRGFIEYNLNPVVNALLRFDRLDEAIEFILGRGLDGGKSRHQAQKDLIASVLGKNLDTDYGRLLLLPIQDSEFRAEFPFADPTNFIGVIANSLKDKKNESVLGIVVRDGKVVRASFRGLYSKLGYRDSFNRNVEHMTASGHRAAFGVSLDDELYESEQAWESFLSSLVDTIEDIETEYESKNSEFKIIELNRMFVGNTQEMLRNIAMENIYLNDEYRTYIRYTGKSYVEVKKTYKTRPLTEDEKEKGFKPDIIADNLVYIKDSFGNKIPKYIEYLVEGRTIKSLNGISIESGLIQPFMGDSGLEFNIVNIK